MFRDFSDHPQKVRKSFPEEAPPGEVREGFPKEKVPLGEVREGFPVETVPRRAKPHSIVGSMAEQGCNGLSRAAPALAEATRAAYILGLGVPSWWDTELGIQ